MVLRVHTHSAVLQVGFPGRSTPRYRVAYRMTLKGCSWGQCLVEGREGSSVLPLPNPVIQAWQRPLLTLFETAEAWLFFPSCPESGQGG